MRSAPSGPARAGVMTSTCDYRPAEGVPVWEELLLLRPGLWRQRPVTATRAPGGRPL